MKKWFTRLGLALALFAGTTTAMAQETLVVDGSKSYLWELTQGTEYVLPGTDGTWYCQPGFFTHKEGNVWTFKGFDFANYAYAIVLNEEKKYVDVTLLNATGGEGVDAASTATYDVNGAIWLNGNSNIGFPDYQKSGINWGGGKDVAVPQIAEKVYQVVMVGGQQINASSINFKFFKGKNWGGDMDENLLYMVENDYMRLNGQDEAVTGDHGNIFGKDGDVGDLDTLYITIDFNNMTNGKGTITVEKKAYTPAAYPQLNGTDLTKFGNTYYADLALTQGQKLTFANLNAIDLDWETIWIDPAIGTKGANGEFTFNAVDGNYHVAVMPNLNFIRFYTGTNDAPGTYQTTGQLWLIGAKVGQPNIDVNNANWAGNLATSVPVAQVAPNVYKAVLKVGEQLGTDVNIKFFSACNWGVEFKGEDLDMVENDYLILKQPEATLGYDEEGNEKLEYGDEDGNIRNGITPLSKGDQLIITVDLNGFAFHEFVDYEIVRHPGKVTVECIPYEGPKPEFAGVTMSSSGDWYYADVNLNQYATYQFKNITEVNVDEAYTDVCFATHEGENEIKFNAIDGQYCVMLNTVQNYIKIFPGTHAAPAGIADGGLWIIGEGFGRPSVNGNAPGWNTGIEKDFPVAQTSPNIFQMDLMCDTEIWDNWCNFKFFGQPNWGIEFVPYTDYSLVAEEGSYLYVNGQTEGDEGDKGNIKFAPDMSFTKGEPVYIVLDFTAGMNAGVLKTSTTPIVDAIQNVKVSTSNAIYNLNGVRVNNANQHGIYIINGKKVVK